MKKLSFLIILFVVMLSAETKAQNYNTAIGVRLGYYNGLTVKHFLSGNKALEGIFTRRWIGWNGYDITGLVEFDNSIGDVSGLSWFYGFGGHLGLWSNDPNAPFYDPNRNGGYTVIGIDGILGLDYTVPNAPINFQLDWKPGVNLIGYYGWWYDGLALSVRFTL